MSKELFVPEACVFESVDELWARYPGAAVIPVVTISKHNDLKENIKHLSGCSYCMECAACGGGLKQAIDAMKDEQ